ncbi:MAG: hypothetical protein V1882_09415, partial [Candidatus Omnitrophota bacterium]
LTGEAPLKPRSEARTVDEAARGEITRSEVRKGEDEFLFDLLRSPLAPDFLDSIWHGTTSMALGSILKEGAILSKSAMREKDLAFWTAMESTELSKDSVSFAYDTDIEKAWKQYAGPRKMWDLETAQEMVRKAKLDPEIFKNLIQIEEERIKTWNAMTEEERVDLKKRFEAQYPVVLGVVSPDGVKSPLRSSVKEFISKGPEFHLFDPVGKNGDRLTFIAVPFAKIEETKNMIRQNPPQKLTAEQLNDLLDRRVIAIEALEAFSYPSAQIDGFLTAEAASAKPSFRESWLREKWKGLEEKDRGPFLERLKAYLEPAQEKPAEVRPTDSRPGLEPGGSGRSEVRRSQARQGRTFPSRAPALFQRYRTWIVGFVLLGVLGLHIGMLSQYRSQNARVYDLQNYQEKIAVGNENIAALQKDGWIFASNMGPWYEKNKEGMLLTLSSGGYRVEGSEIRQFSKPDPSKKIFDSAMLKGVMLFGKDGEARIVPIEKFEEKDFLASEWPNAFQAGPMAMTNGVMNSKIKDWHSGFWKGRKALIGVDESGKVYTLDLYGWDILGVTGPTSERLMSAVIEWAAENDIQDALFVDGGTTKPGFGVKSPPFALMMKKGPRASSSLVGVETAPVSPKIPATIASIPIVPKTPTVKSVSEKPKQVSPATSASGNVRQAVLKDPPTTKRSAFKKPVPPPTRQKVPPKVQASRRSEVRENEAAKATAQEFEAGIASVQGALKGMTFSGIRKIVQNLGDRAAQLSAEMQVTAILTWGLVRQGDVKAAIRILGEFAGLVDSTDLVKQLQKAVPESILTISAEGGKAAWIQSGFADKASAESYIRKLFFTHLWNPATDLRLLVLGGTVTAAEINGMIKSVALEFGKPEFARRSEVRVSQAKSMKEKSVAAAFLSGYLVSGTGSAFDVLGLDPDRINFIQFFEEDSVNGDPRALSSLVKASQRVYGKDSSEAVKLLRAAAESPDQKSGFVYKQNQFRITQNSLLSAFKAVADLFRAFQQISKAA